MAEQYAGMNSFIEPQLLASFQTSAEQVAFYCQGETFTYAQLAERVSAIAEALGPLELGTKVLIVAEDHIDTYASNLAVLLLGGTYVPVLLKHPAERNLAILKQVKPRWIMCASASGAEHFCRGTGAETGEAFAEIALNNLKITETIARSHTRFQFPDNIPASTEAYILFTSGSTGIPKGVPITRRALGSFLQAAQHLAPIHPKHRVLQMFDLTFDLSVVSYLLPLLKGAMVCVPKSGRIKSMDILTCLMDQKITHALMVPSILLGLQAFLGQIKLPELQVSQFCGEALPADLVRKWAGCLAPTVTIQNVYGPTEATIYCMVYTCDLAFLKERNGVVCCGQPFGETTVMIEPEADEVTTKNEHSESDQPIVYNTSEPSENINLKPQLRGQLCLQGPQLSEGYYNNEEQTQRAFFRASSGLRSYRTGDLVEQDSEGDYYYIGRLDQQVQIQGFRVELGEIEEAARRCGVSAAVAVFNEEPSGGRLSLFVDKKSCPAGLAQSLEKSLPSYMLPQKILTVDEFPLNANGKIDRKVLKAQAKVG
jgi:D-alanine--poly(phosphoribitol) ligase subunit 1